MPSHAAAAFVDATTARLVVHDRGLPRSLPLADVLWIESFGNYARVQTRSARFLHRATMAELERELAPHGFWRIHRTLLVNAAHVRELRPTGASHGRVALLDTGQRLRVSRRFRNAPGPLPARTG